MDRDKPLMLTRESWSDIESRRGRATAHQKSEHIGTKEHVQKQKNLGAMTELREKSTVSKRRFYWAQDGSRDMFTQAVARNAIAISKEKHAPIFNNPKK